MQPRGCANWRSPPPKFVGARLACEEMSRGEQKFDTEISGQQVRLLALYSGGKIVHEKKKAGGINKRRKRSHAGGDGATQTVRRSRIDLGLNLLACLKWST